MHFFVFVMDTFFFSNFVDEINYACYMQKWQEQNLKLRVLELWLAGYT